jgi:hypothetical protein
VAEPQLLTRNAPVMVICEQQRDVEDLVARKIEPDNSSPNREGLPFSMPIGLS